MKHLPFTSPGARDRISTAASPMICGLRDEDINLPSARLATADVAIYVSGQRQAKPMPASAYSAAQPSDSSVIPYFDNVYDGWAPNQYGFMFSGGPRVTTCADALCASRVRSADVRRCGSAAFVNRNVPRTLMSIIRSNFLAESSSVGSVAIALALFITMSTPPKCSIAVSTARCTSSSLRTSPPPATPLPPAASTSATAVYTVPGNLGCGSAVLASSTTFAPCLAAPSAIASPMPRLPPETTSVRSVKVDMGLLNARANAVLACYRIGSRILILGK